VSAATPGQAAHARWQQAAAVLGVTTDDWDELEQWDREAWEASQEPHAVPGEADCTVCAQVGGPHGVPADNSILLSGPRSEAVAAPELAAALAEPRELRKVITELLSMFKGISGGYGARTSSSRLRKIAARAGVHWDSLTLPAPDTTEAAETKRLREALENVFAVLDRQPLTYAERISYARTLIRTARDGQ
jgi:hypothetical protein